MWKEVQTKGFFGDLHDTGNDFFQIAIKEFNVIKHSRQATLIVTTLTTTEISTPSNFVENAFWRTINGCV